ncbi:synaptotagmin-5-like isoform X1 [Python bivittatus]|uniref:Synaptotagmin-5-like isoform X1 n=1 Tax=Python bivittatus TaxID=176946 RepID=A0A9F5IU94_PYTBI|nr:synaptotagmin-5-like isoform X1 [Python bivittatus]
MTVPLLVFWSITLALPCFSFFLGCTVCWYQLKKRRLSKSKAEPLDQMLLELEVAQPSVKMVAPIQEQYVQIEGEVQNNPPLTAANLPGLSIQETPQKSFLCGRASLPNIPVPQKLLIRSHLGWTRRCTISGDNRFASERTLLSHPILGTNSPSSYFVSRTSSNNTTTKTRPHLHFGLFYSQPRALLTVTVIRLSHLPTGFWASRNSYVKVYVLPRFDEPQRTALHKKSLHPEFHEQFQFGRYSLEDLSRLTLRFAVYTKNFHSIKNSFLGEVMFPCTQVAWKQNISSVYTQELSPTKTKIKKCFSSQDRRSSAWLSQPNSVGQLFLLLQYQALANRIKVLVRKAENLERLTCFPGTPDHYVMINFYHDGKVIDMKETKSVAGYNPVWNIPFLFSVPAGDIQKQRLFLEFTVIQAHLFPRSWVVGRVLIGPDVPGMGQLHWKEMYTLGNVESARWHLIQPEGFQP